MKEVNFRKIVLSLFFVFAFGLVGCNKERQGLVNEDEINGTNTKVVEDNYGNITESEKFVVEVDPDVNNWQTKEAEFFTIKFPKEWYWLESDRSENEGYSTVITNNPDFDMSKNSEIGIFAGVGSVSPLSLTDNTEIVISHRGTPTSNAGQPIDSLNAILSLAKENNPSASCAVVDDLNIPLKAHCSIVFDDEARMRQQVYYLINDELTLAFAAWTTLENDSDLIDILSKISQSLVLKK